MTDKRTINQAETVEEATALVERHLYLKAQIDRTSKILHQFPDLMDAPEEIREANRQAYDEMQFGYALRLDDAVVLLDRLIALLEQKDTELKSDRR